LENQERPVTPSLANTVEQEFWCAVERSDVPCIETLLTAHADLVSAVDGKGQTAVFTACRLSDARVLKLLLSHGADASARDSVGMTPFLDMMMRWKQRHLVPTDIVDTLLLCKNVDIWEKTPSGVCLATLILGI
jgi:hypothetical protein